MNTVMISFDLPPISEKVTNRDYTKFLFDDIMLMAFKAGLTWQDEFALLHRPANNPEILAALELVSQTSQREFLFENNSLSKVMLIHFLQIEYKKCSDTLTRANKKKINMLNRLYIDGEKLIDIPTTLENSSKTLKPPKETGGVLIDLKAGKLVSDNKLTIQINPNLKSILSMISELATKKFEDLEVLHYQISGDSCYAYTLSTDSQMIFAKRCLEDLTHIVVKLQKFIDGPNDLFDNI